jgi:ABC-type multidrug transport system permease subunit
MEQQNDKSFFVETEEVVEQYVRDRLLLFRLQATEKASHLIALMVSGILIGMVGFFIMIFLSIMAGYYFSEITGSLFYGFGIITLFYIVLFVVLLLFRKKYLHKWIVDTVVRIVMDNKNDEDDA